ncbi:hypothetical protein ACK8UJ_005413 [Klebsiella pneumoniae]
MSIQAIGVVLLSLSAITLLGGVLFIKHNTKSIKQNSTTTLLLIEPEPPKK